MNAAPARHYKLLKSALPAAERTVQSSYFIPAILMVAAAALITSLFVGVRSGSSMKASIISAVSFALILTYLAFSIPRKALRCIRKMWDTYELEIGADYLLRRQTDLPDLRLRFDEVRKVEQFPGRYLRVIGNPSLRLIEIPQGIENFEEVLSTISTIMRVQAPHTEPWQKRVLVMAAGSAGFLTMLWSKSLALVVPLAIGMSVYFVWTFLRIRRNPNCSRSTRRIAWIYLPFVVVCVLKVLEAIGRNMQR